MPTQNTISSEIARELRSEILRGHFREGERLPSERDLAARFSASRGAVREALSQIEQLGLIAIKPGGARVQPLRDARIAVLGPLMALHEIPDPKLLENFLQTFGALATLTAEEAISRGSSEQLNRLQEHVVSIQNLSDDFAAQQQQWREFFSYLSEVADNLVVQLIGNDLKAQFVEQAIKLGITPVFRKRVMAQILSALKQGFARRDKEKVRTALQLYFQELTLRMQQAQAEFNPDLQLATA